MDGDRRLRLRFYQALARLAHQGTGADIDAFFVRVERVLWDAETVQAACWLLTGEERRGEDDDKVSRIG